MPQKRSVSIPEGLAWKMNEIRKECWGEEAGREGGKISGRRSINFGLKGEFTLALKIIDTFPICHCDFIAKKNLLNLSVLKKP